MHSYIISGGTPSVQKQHVADLLTAWHVQRFEIITPDETLTSIGIGDIRALTSRLSLSPAPGHIHVALIAQGHLLTVPAQQALLKTLEEPPGQSHIIICVPNIACLLPTIISRCQTIPLAYDAPYTEEALAACRQSLVAATRLSPGARIAWCQTMGKTKEELIAFLTLAITATRDGATKSPTDTEESETLWKLLRRYTDAAQYIDTNANLQAIIERAMLSL